MAAGSRFQVCAMASIFGVMSTTRRPLAAPSFPNGSPIDSLSAGCNDPSHGSTHGQVGLQRKVNDAAIVAKWKAEALEQEPQLSAQAFDWCILELRDKALYFQRTGLIHALDSENRCVKSDVLLSSEFLTNLRQAVRPLLDIDPAKRTGIRDPTTRCSISFILRYSRSSTDAATSCRKAAWASRTCVDACGRGTPFPEQSKPAPPATPGRGLKEHEIAEFYSYRFQWLPCDVLLCW